MTDTSLQPAKIPTCRLPGGEEIPCIGMGTFGSDKYDAGTVAEAVRGALRFGYRLFDCASVYGNEDRIGRALEAEIQAGTVRRDAVFLISKVWNDMHGKGDVLLSLAKTLRDLRTDYIDLFLVHWPFRNSHPSGCDGDARDPHAKPFSVDNYLETWRQMERLVDLGLARHIGMSNMTIPKLEAVLPHCRILPSAVEMELHPSFQQKELYAYCRARGILPVGYCPLGSPSRPARDHAPGDVSDMALPAVAEAAQAHGVHPALVCIKWAVQTGHLVIPFAVKPAQYQSNLRCVCSDPLTEEEMARIRASDCGCRLVKGQVFLWEGARDWTSLWDPDGTITAT